MRVAIGADHAGFGYKEEIGSWLRDAGHEVIDVGAHAATPSDYPDFAERVAGRLLAGDAERGILICGSAVGVCVAANKYPGIRAGTCHDSYSAHQGVEHDDMNVLCLGQRVIGIELAREVVDAFLGARFSGKERHRRRLHKVHAIEERTMRRERAGAGPAA